MKDKKPLEQGIAVRSIPRLEDFSTVARVLSSLKGTAEPMEFHGIPRWFSQEEDQRSFHNLLQKDVMRNGIKMNLLA